MRMDARNWRSGGGADYYDDDSLLTHSLQLTKQVKYIRKFLAIYGPMIYMAPYVMLGNQDLFWAL